jgi:hypothetical protein
MSYVLSHIGVNAIAQSGIHVAVASNVPKGQLEFVPPAVSKEETDDFRSENKMGSVIYWRQRRELRRALFLPCPLNLFLNSST